VSSFTIAPLATVITMLEWTDEEIRTVVAEQFGDEIRACTALRDFAVGELQAWSGRAIKRGADRIIIAEAARGTKTFDAGIQLCEHGFGEQGAMLNRSLFEGMAIAHWVSDNRREAVRLFTRHAKYSALLWHETFDALGWLSETESKAAIGVAPRQRNEFKRLFGRYGEKAWVGRSVPELLRQIEHLWDREGRTHLWAFHDVPYRFSNQILHSSATAAGAATTRQTAEALHMTFGPSNQFIAQALFAAYWTYGQLFSLLVHVFRLSSGDSFSAVYQAGGEVFSNVREARD
jgi:Family of unknown function (DUF5677)